MTPEFQRTKKQNLVVMIIIFILDPCTLMPARGLIFRPRPYFSSFPFSITFIDCGGYEQGDRLVFFFSFFLRNGNNSISGFYSQISSESTFLYTLNTFLGKPVTMVDLTAFSRGLVGPSQRSTTAWLCI